MSAPLPVTPSNQERIGTVSFRAFALLPRQDQLAHLANWAARAAEWLEAGTAPVRWKGKALALRVTQWAAAVGLVL